MDSVTKEGGIYKILNKVNGNCYIGSSKWMYYRTKGHLSALRHGIHANKHLQNSWNKHGENNFEFSVVEICDECELMEREQHYIDELMPEYNKTLDVIRQIPSKESNKKHSETKSKMYKDGSLIPNGEKQIFQYDSDGNFIKSYRSMSIASRESNCCHSAIRRCARGDYEQANGYQWFYKYMGEKVNKTHNKKRKFNTIKLFKFTDINTSEILYLNAFEITEKFKVSRENFVQYANKNIIFKKQYKIERTNKKIKIALLKSDKLLGNPEEDNQQPI